jgi:ATP-dependent protease HslVU (ClpYQ) ATPase subunit
MRALTAFGFSSVLNNEPDVSAVAHAAFEIYDEVQTGGDRIRTRISEGFVFQIVFRADNVVRVEDSIMINFKYLSKGLNALARAHQMNSMAGLRDPIGC